MKKSNSDQSRKLNQLVSLMVKGDRDAFAAIYKMYFNKLFRYGSIIHPEPRIVEDTIQELFIWIIEHPKKVKNLRHFEVYLFQSLKRNLREHKKRKNRTKEIIHQIAQESAADLQQNSIEKKWMEEEHSDFNRNWVKQKLDELPAHQKEIIFLRYYEGLSYEEIAEITSTSNQVIRNYVSRAIKKLRKLSKLEKLISLLF